MINHGLALTAAALGFAVVGGIGYVTARRSSSHSRWAALTLFGHLSLFSAAALFVATTIHIHSILTFEIHVHALQESVASIFVCDLDLSCGILTAGLVVFLVFAATFGITQGSERLLLRQLSRRRDEVGLARLRATRPTPAAGVEFLVVCDPTPDAFAFALLRLDRKRLPRAVSIVVVTRGLVDLLEPEELRAAVAHELAHVRARDDRYLPYFRTLASLLFFDPLLRTLHRRVSRRHEFAADREAATRTCRPRDLARALLKVFLYGHPCPKASGFAGKSRSELLARIEVLIAMEEAIAQGEPLAAAGQC